MGDTEFFKKQLEQMNNPFKTMWQWKLFYWKIFAAVAVTGCAAMSVGLSGQDGSIMSVEIAIKVIFWSNVISVMIKAVDSLLDQTFGKIKSDLNGNGNGNGNGHPATTTTTNTVTTTGTQIGDKK